MTKLLRTRGGGVIFVQAVGDSGVEAVLGANHPDVPEP